MTTTRTPLLGFLGFALAAACPLARGGPARGEASASVPAIEVPRARAAPRVDGRLDDEAWKGSAVIAGLFPATDAGADVRLAKLPTTVRLLWDPEFLYVAFECADDEVHGTGEARARDQIYMEDVCEVFLDAAGDGRQVFEVQSSPRGRNFTVLYLYTREPEYSAGMRLSQEFCRTDRWKFPGWEAAGLKTAGRVTSRDGRPAGWTVEMAIPAGPVAKRLGRETLFPTEIRANFVRYDWPPSGPDGKRELLQQTWSPVLKGCPHISPSRMGRLRLVE
jgi:hypothetical protein